MLGIVGMLASCSQDEVLPNSSGESVMTVTASLSDGIKTRATNLTDEELATIKRCKLLVYNQDTQTSEMKEGVLSDNTFTFDLRLASSATYSFYCWADDGSSYDIADDGSITMTSAMPTIAQRAEETGIRPTDKGTLNMALTNAVAKVVLGTTGNITEAADISVTAQTYKGYNLKDGATTGVAEEITGSTSGFTTDAATELNPVEVLSFYLLVDNASPNQNVLLKNGQQETTVANVPFKPDYRTLLKGDLSEVSKNITITAQMDEDWDDANQPITATAGDGVITTTRAGQLVGNPDLIEQAIATGSKVAINGPMNAEDLAVVANWIKEHSDTNVELDFGNTSGLTQIPGSCFDGASNLIAIVLPPNLVATPASSSDAVGYNAFRGTGITSITVPAGVTYPNNFCNIYGLMEIHLMGSISGLGSQFVQNCNSLTDIYFHNTTSAPWIGNSGALSGFTKSNVTVHLPVGTNTETWRTAYDYWNDFKYSADIEKE